MSYSQYVGAGGLNEQRKIDDASAAAQRAARQQAQEQQSWDRGRQSFQEGIIAQEQQRKNQESQNAARLAQYEAKHKYGRNGMFDAFNANAPAMAAAQMLGGAGNVPGHSVGMYDNAGGKIGQSWLRHSLLG